METRNSDEILEDAHYKQGSIETIEMMIRIWGPSATVLWIEMTIFKYSQRIGLKGSPEEDYRKMTTYREMMSRIKRDYKL